jgi:predicted DNA-binding transcriptional regulator YafY
MRRADRLIELLGLVGRARGPAKAEDLAVRLEVSVRTIYRDVATLQAMGYPIAGQAGFGYMLTAPAELPPLTFDHDQLEALALGLAYVEQVGDPPLAAAARTARGKIDAAWTGGTIPGPGDSHMRAAQRAEHRAPAFAASFRGAIRDHRLVAFRYRDATGKTSRRKVRPLALNAFSLGWLLIAWCTTRRDFRVFRLDRMSSARVLDEPFPEEPGRDLAAFMALRRAETATATRG